MGNAYIKSLGCISNLMDGTAFEAVLQTEGYRLTSDLSEADLVLINTCAFNKIKEDEAVAFINRARKTAAPGARLVVCGCLPEINRARLSHAHPDLVFGPLDPWKLGDIISLARNHAWLHDGPISYTQYSPLKKTIFRVKRVSSTLPVVRDSPLVRRLLGPFFIYDPDVCCIRVASGCIGHCSYCAIRFAKGSVKSRPTSDVMAAIGVAVDHGYSKLVLAGDEITAYGHDQGGGVDIIDVIDRVLANRGVHKLYLESFEPGFMIANLDAVCRVLASGRVPVFCSSAQSGSNRVLKQMCRNYTASDFEGALTEIRQSFPNIHMRSEFIAGFPGETEEDHQKSLELISRLKLDFIDVYTYEDRPGTAASRMPDKVPDRVKATRRRQLLRRHWMNIMRGKRKV